MDGIIDNCGNAAKFGGTGLAGGLLLALGWAALTIICPVVGPVIMGAGIGLAADGGAVTAGAGVVAAGAKIKKSIDS